MNRFTHGGNIYDAPAPHGEWMDFSANINPLGLSESVRAAIESGIPKLIHYPDPAAKELKRAIADYYDALVESVVLGNGGAELFYVLFHALRPRRLLLPIPSFSEYERAALSAGTEICYVRLREEDSFALPEDELIGAMRPGDCLLVGNPNNPTGNLVGVDVWKRLLRAAEEKDILVVADESFMDFREDAADYAARTLAGQSRHLVVVQSMTKFFALPGLRLGFAVADPQTARRLEAAKDPWNVNLLAQRAGVAALSDEAHRRATLKWLGEERAFLFGALREMPDLKAYEPTVNFILLRLGAKLGSAADFCARMKEEGILLRDCSNYPGLDDTFVRVAVKTREENERLLEAFRRAGRAVL